MKLTNNRTYLDNNATTPLASSVLQWMASGVFPFGNPSSIHTSGKKSKKLINQTISDLKNHFDLPDFEIFFHSGATEGINNIVKGFCFHFLKKKEKFHFVCFASDHSCVVNQREHVELLGGEFHCLEILSSGDFELENVKSYIKGLDGQVLLNFTLVNNETGVHWPIEKAVDIKQECGCVVHVDAVQMPGKISQDLSLSDQLDFYTFSGHKFGAMKGIGFTLTRGLFNNWCSLIRGGGQQMAMRSGTENVHAIYSIKLALDELVQSYDEKALRCERDFLENELVKLGGGSILATAVSAQYRNANTIYLIIDQAKTDVLITAFDMASIDLSSGSACSSGAVRPSRVLLAMGYSEQQAKSSIRISLPYKLDHGDGKVIFDKVAKVISRFIK